MFPQMKDDKKRFGGREWRFQSTVLHEQIPKNENSSEIILLDVFFQMRFDNSGSYVFIHVQQQGQFSNILDKWNIKICNLNLTFKHTEDQVLRSSSPPNRNRSAEIQRLLYPQKADGKFYCIHRKRSPFKIKPFSDIYVKFQGNSRELNFSKCHGHVQNKDSFTQRWS